MKIWIYTFVLAAMLACAGSATFAQAPPDPEPAPSVDALLAAAVTALQDARTGAQTGQADVDLAMADRETAAAALAAADQHVADTVAARDGSHGDVVSSIDVLFEVLQAMRDEHAPRPPPGG